METGSAIASAAHRALPKVAGVKLIRYDTDKDVVCAPLTRHRAPFLLDLSSSFNLFLTISVHLINKVGQELNAVAQNLVANPAATSLNYNTCNIRPGRSSSGGGVGRGGLSLEQGQQMRGGYASSSNYAISPTFARSGNGGATSTTFTGVGGGSGAMNLSGLSGTTRDGRPGSPSNSGGVVTPVPPLAFPLDGFNFGGDSCEVKERDDNDGDIDCVDDDDFQGRVCSTSFL